MGSCRRYAQSLLKSAIYSQKWFKFTDVGRWLNVSCKLHWPLSLIDDRLKCREVALELIIVIILQLLLLKHTHNSSPVWRGQKKHISGLQKCRQHISNQFSTVNNYSTRRPHSFSMATVALRLLSLLTKKDITTCLQSTSPKLVSQKAQYWDQQMWIRGKKISLGLWRSYFRLWNERGKSSLSGYG